MSSTTLLRFAARSQPTCLFRSPQSLRRLSPPRISLGQAGSGQFSTSLRRATGEREGGEGHHDETFEEFTARYIFQGADLVTLMPRPVRRMKQVESLVRGLAGRQLADESFIRYEREFDNVQDVFELQVV